MRRAGKRLRSGIVILTTCVLSLTACDRGDHPGGIGSPAREFTLTDGAQKVDLAQFRGHIVIVNFWATYCLPCIEELPSLLALQRRMPELAIVAVSWDDDPAAYQRFLTLHHVDLLTIRDPSQKVATLYGTALIPETYIIDRNGILRRKFVSAQDWTSPDILSYLRRL